MASDLIAFEPKLRAMVNAARFIARSEHSRTHYFFNVPGQPDVSGLIEFERHYGTLTARIEDEEWVLAFFLRFGPPSVAYTNLSSRAFPELACLHPPARNPMTDLDVALKTFLHTARALHHIATFLAQGADKERQIPESGIELRTKLQNFQLPGKRVA